MGKSDYPASGARHLRGHDDQVAPARLLSGQVMHERLRPARHRFVYPSFCVRLDLARTKAARNAWFGVDCRRLMSVRTRDYGGRDGSDLLDWVRAQLTMAGVTATAGGAVWLQTFPRMFGFVFNPVSFFLCHDPLGGLRAVLAEVNSTFGETQHYLLTAPGHGLITADTRLECDKQLHVSPFCEVRGFYRFRFRESDDTAVVGIDYFDEARAASPTAPLMRTAIGGKLAPLTAASAFAALCRQPLMTLGVVARIHWQAWLLWRKRVPWFHKPPRPEAPAASSEKEMSS